MKGKCSCGKKATREYLITKDKTAWTIKVCEIHAPTYDYNLQYMELIDWKNKNKIK